MSWKLATAFIALIVLGSPQEAETKPVTSEDASKLAWIVGTWEFAEGEKTTVEQWMPHAGTTFMGMSHTYSAKRTHFFEFLRIATHGGKIAYIAQPGGDPPVLFRAVKLTEEEAVFENPENDHPQRIRYVKTEKGITATISLMDGSKAKDFVFERRGK
ncbi:MAG: DUF6265 family protein [Planctomycetota bacterium]